MLVHCTKVPRCLLSLTIIRIHMFLRPPSPVISRLLSWCMRWVVIFLGGDVSCAPHVAFFIAGVVILLPCLCQGTGQNPFICVFVRETKMPQSRCYERRKGCIHKCYLCLPVISTGQCVVHRNESPELYKHQFQDYCVGNPFGSFSGQGTAVLTLEA